MCVTKAIIFAPDSLDNLHTRFVMETKCRLRHYKCANANYSATYFPRAYAKWW